MLRLRFLLLILVLLLLGGTLTPVEAARPTRYARAKMHGRYYTHRPFFKLYKGRKSGRKKRFSFRRKQTARPARPHTAQRHATR